MKRVIGQSFDLVTGNLRVKEDPPEDEYPEYLTLNGVVDDPQTGDDDERLERIMEMFQNDAQYRGKKSFNMEFVAAVVEDSEDD